jgi:hypothetical protein
MDGMLPTPKAGGRGGGWDPFPSLAKKQKKKTDNNNRNDDKK